MYALPLAVLFGALCGAASVLPVDWAAVPATPVARSDTDTKAYGECMCDLTARCDADCCCDTDCSSAVRSSFSFCRQEVVGADEVERCTSDASALRIVRSRRELQTQEKPARNAVCVVRTNSYFGLKEFFGLPTPADVQTLAQPASPWPAPAALPTPAFPSGHRLPYLQAVAAGTPAVWRALRTGDGYLRVPRAGPDGQCTYDSTAKALVGEKTSCYVAGATLSAMCGSSLSIAENAQFIALTAPGFGVADGQTVHPVNTEVITLSTGAIVGAAVSSAALFNSLIFNVGTATGPTLPAATTFAANKCTNAVIGESIVITYTATAQGIRVAPGGLTRRLYIGDITGAATRVARFFNIEFVRQGVTPTEAVPPRSGNPGYVAGVPLLAGRLVTETGGTKTAVAAQSSGLQLPVGRNCADKAFAQVRFLEDVTTTSCGVDLSEAELQTLCGSATGTDTLLQAALTPLGQTSHIIDRLGFSGNVASTSVADWVTLEGMPWTSATPQPFNTLQRQCSNLITGLHFVVGVARAGIVFNPQDVIPGAKVFPIMGGWRYTGTGATARFTFTFKVSFVRLAEDAAVKRDPIVPPSILPSGEDLFYPFRLPDERVRDTAASP